MEPSSTKPVNKWLVLIAVAMGVFLATIDGSIVNIGLNTIVNDLHQPLNVVEWVVLAYMLTISTLMLSIGRLSDMIGKKKLYLAGIIIFTIGSGLMRDCPLGLLADHLSRDPGNWRRDDHGNRHRNRHRCLPAERTRQSPGSDGNHGVS